ncbi:MAG: DUF4157 domain-containing protein [Solirubrobacteraceae bacterium]
MRQGVIVRILERIGDNAVDIAEHVSFLVTGKVHDAAPPNRGPDLRESRAWCVAGAESGPLAEGQGRMSASMQAVRRGVEVAPVPGHVTRALESPGPRLGAGLGRTLGRRVPASVGSLPRRSGFHVVPSSHATEDAAADVAAATGGADGGWDFSHVRVHADAPARDSAAALGASAYTVRDHVVLGPGAPGPRTGAGRGLLAHELTHVAQQRGQRPGDGIAVQRQEAPKQQPAPPTQGQTLGKEMTPADQAKIDNYLSNHKFTVRRNGQVETDGGPIPIAELVTELHERVVPDVDLLAIENYVHKKVQKKQRDQKIFGALPPAPKHERTLGQTIEDVLTKPRPTPTGPPNDVPSQVTQQGDFGKVIQGGRVPGGPSISTPKLPIPGSKPTTSPAWFSGGPRATYLAGETVTFTVTPPKDFWTNAGAKRVVLLDAKSPNNPPIAATDLQPASTTPVRWQAPSKPGKYLIRVLAGTNSFGSQELTVQ